MRGRRVRGWDGGAQCGTCCVPGGGWSLRAPAASEGAAEWRAAMRDRRERECACRSGGAGGACGVAFHMWRVSRERCVGVSCAATAHWCVVSAPANQALVGERTVVHECESDGS